MSLFDAQALQEAIFLTDPDQTPGAKAVTIKFKNGSTRAVNAMVYEYEIRAEPGGAAQRVFLVGFANNSTSGLAASEFDNNGVEARLSFRGGAAEYYTLRWPTSDDPVPANEPLDGAWCWFVAGG